MPDISDHDLLREVYKCLSASGALSDLLKQNPSVTKDRVDDLFKEFADHIKARSDASSPRANLSKPSSRSKSGAGLSVKRDSTETALDKLVIHVDGASRGNPGPAAFGVVVYDRDSNVVEEAGERVGKATNNVAEYKGLIFGVKRAVELGARKVTFKSDSDLMVKQINHVYKVRSGNIRPLHREAVRHLAEIPKWSIQHVPREENRAADAQANRALDAGE